MVPYPNGFGGTVSEKLSIEGYSKRPPAAFSGCFRAHVPEYAPRENGPAALLDDIFEQPSFHVIS